MGSPEPCGIYIAGYFNETIIVDVSRVDVTRDNNGVVAVSWYLCFSKYQCMKWWKSSEINPQSYKLILGFIVNNNTHQYGMGAYFYYVDTKDKRGVSEMSTFFYVDIWPAYFSSKVKIFQFENHFFPFWYQQFHSFHIYWGKIPQNLYFVLF